MADFKTHISVSTLGGIAYGVAGYQSGLPLQTCLVAGGLCSVSGMLPDLDSDSGIPLREAVSFGSAVIPMLMVERFERLGLNHETMVLAAGVVYVVVRFGIAEIFRRYTVHRGMWHSIPAAIMAGMFAFLVMCCEDFRVRMFKTMAVVLGFVIHLLIDEIWAIDFRGGKFHFKKSFGTALKLWGNDTWAALSTYTKMVLLALLVYNDEGLMQRYGYDDHTVPHTAVQWIQMLRGQEDETVIR